MPRRRKLAKRKLTTVRGLTAGTNVPTTQCATWANDYLRQNGYIAYGNAWDSKGSSLVYSGYDGLDRPTVYDKQAVKAYNNAASDNVYKNFNSKKQLKKGNTYTVNMYYNGSPYLEEAYNNGRNKRSGTHTGVLMDDEQGNWYVVHNIHGKLHVDPFTQIQGGNKPYGVTSIFEPRKDNPWNNLITRLGLKYGGSISPYYY